MRPLFQLIRQQRGFLLFMFLMFVFRSVVADWNSVPTGSMKPTIVEGDRLLVNKMAYDLRLPFSHVSLLHLADPQRGDIVIFDSAVSNKRLVKRVIGIPGDNVAMVNNQLVINEQPLPYELTVRKTTYLDAEENLFGSKHAIRIHPLEHSSLSSFNAVTIPENHFLVLGDNRDRSADSRMIGLIPRHEIVGRARHIVMSLDYDDFFLPRKERFFKPLAADT